MSTKIALKGYFDRLQVAWNDKHGSLPYNYVMKPNTIQYSETGNRCWQNPMPTWRIDGRDLVELLGLTRLAENRVWGVGVDPTHPFIYPERSVFHELPVMTSARQFVLVVHLGDSIAAFVTVLVSSEEEAVHWRDFETVEGTKTTLAAVGPFSFHRGEYARVMRGALLPAFAALKELQMYSHLNDKSFDGLW